MTSQPTPHFHKSKRLHYTTNRRHRRALHKLCATTHDPATLRSLSARVWYYDSHQACRQARWYRTTIPENRHPAKFSLTRLP